MNMKQYVYVLAILLSGQLLCGAAAEEDEIIPVYDRYAELGKPIEFKATRPVPKTFYRFMSKSKKYGMQERAITAVGLLPIVSDSHGALKFLYTTVSRDGKGLARDTVWTNPVNDWLEGEDSLTTAARPDVLGMIDPERFTSENIKARIRKYGSLLQHVDDFYRPENTDGVFTYLVYLGRLEQEQLDQVNRKIPSVEEDRTGKKYNALFPNPSMRARQHRIERFDLVSVANVLAAMRENEDKIEHNRLSGRGTCVEVEWDHPRLTNFRKNLSSELVRVLATDRNLYSVGLWADTFNRSQNDPYALTPHEKRYEP